LPCLLFRNCPKEIFQKAAKTLDSTIENCYIRGMGHKHHTDSTMKTTYDYSEAINVAALKIAGFKYLGTAKEIFGKEELGFSDGYKVVAEWEGLPIIAPGINFLAVGVGKKVYELGNLQSTSDAELKTEVKNIISILDRNLSQLKQS
jgi:hypothetical protein